MVTRLLLKYLPPRKKKPFKILLKVKSLFIVYSNSFLRYYQIIWNKISFSHFHRILFHFFFMFILSQCIHIKTKEYYFSPVPYHYSPSFKKLVNDLNACKINWFFFSSEFIPHSPQGELKCIIFWLAMWIFLCKRLFI